MQPIAIVLALDAGLKVRAEVIEVPIGVGVDLLALERLHEALTAGMVIGIGRPAHARDHVVRAQHRPVLPGRLWDAAISMMDQSRRQMPRGEGGRQRRER